MFFQTILQIIPSYQLSFLIGNKDVDYLVVYVLSTRRSLKLRSGTQNLKAILKTAQQSAIF